MARSSLGDRTAGTIVFAATAAVFSGALANGFVNWDDSTYLLSWNGWRGVSWEHWKFLLTHARFNLYQPLTWISFSVDYSLWGLDPRGYHLTSVLLHALNAFLFYRVARRLLPATGRPDDALAASAFAALVFSLHPLRVEPAVWVVGRVTLLSGAFLLGSLLCYLDESSPRARAWAAPALYLLSLLAHPAFLLYPFALLALDFLVLRRRRSDASVWREKIPYAAAAAIIGTIAVGASLAARTLTPVAHFSLESRLAQTAYGLGFYLWKTLAPWGLLPCYEPPAVLRLASAPVLFAGGAALAAVAALAAARKHRPQALAAAAVYLLALIPVLGLVKVRRELAADRYSYLACMGLALLAGGALSRALDGSRRRVALAGAGALTVLLAAVSWAQVRVWKDSESLWRHVVAVEPAHGIGRYMLGRALMNAGRAEEGLAELRAAAKSRPDMPEIRFGLGQAAARQGMVEEAARHLREALALQPGFIDAYTELGGLLEKLGRWDEAAVEYATAAELKDKAGEPPGRRAAARALLARALDRSGHVGRAIEQYQASLRLDQRQPRTLLEVGRLLHRLGRLQEARRILGYAVAADPGGKEARSSLADVEAALAGK